MEFNKLSQTVNILGTEYLIRHINYEDDDFFSKEGIDGWCSSTRNEIVIGRLVTFPIYQNEKLDDLLSCEKLLLRHEIVHAFFEQSGLGANSSSAESWATNEEMVDWIAKQGSKIYKAWEEAGAL